MSVTIHASGRTFITQPECWLAQSRFFNNLFSGAWGDRAPDGSYRIGADPDLFEHILRYLRSAVLPVFYDQAKGHDYTLYQALLAEASYFQCDRLEAWLKGQEYMGVVKIEYNYCNGTSGPLSNSNELLSHNKTNASWEVSVHPSVRGSSVWYCRGRRQPSMSEGCKCSKRDAKENDCGYRYEDVVGWYGYEKKTIFDHKLCAEWGLHL